MDTTGETIITYSEDNKNYKSLFDTRTKTDFNVISNVINDFKKGIFKVSDTSHDSCGYCVTTVRLIENSDWYLIFKIQKDELTFLIYSNTIRLIIIAVIILIIGFLGIYLLTTPLIRKIEDYIKEIQKVHNDQKNMYNQLQVQKEEFETIFNYAKDGIAIIDLKGNFKKVNGAIVEMTGFKESELLKLNCNELTAPKDKEKNKKAMENVIQKGKLIHFEKECIVADNRSIVVDLSISLLPDKDHLLFIVKDVTQRKKDELELLKRSRCTIYSSKREISL